MKTFLSLVLLLLPTVNAISQKPAGTKQPVLTARSVKNLQIDGLQFKDLNKNGKLDVYEDWRRPNQERVKDLVAQMTLEEKAGTMMHGTLRTGGQMGSIGFGAIYCFLPPSGAAWLATV